MHYLCNRYTAHERNVVNVPDADTSAPYSRTGYTMGEKAPSIYFSQLRAMLIRNLLLKKREKRKTTAVSTLKY